jgi:SAM-dependent methyltransferase
VVFGPDVSAESVLVREVEMPISWEWHRRIEDFVKPCGDHRWYDAAVAHACEELADKDRAVVLDAGCGDDSWIIGRIRQRGVRPYVIGLDIDESCHANQDIDEARVSSIYTMPLAPESADLVMSGYVFEHLEDPDAALAEIYRVMKPGARFIAWMPNRWNPVMVLSSLTSQRVHTRLRRLTWGAKRAENAPTYYRVNTTAKLRTAAARAGFVCEYLDTYSSAFTYFRMSKATFFLACAANKVMVLWPLNKFRLTLLCVLRKPAVAAMAQAAAR